jgi:hypothetical protein
LRICFDTHILNSEVGWINDDSFNYKKKYIYKLSHDHFPLCSLCSFPLCTCPCASPPSKRIEGGGAALLVFNSCREEVPLSRSDLSPLRKKQVHLLVLIPFVILLLLLPWLAALCGVEKKGEEASREGKERFRGALARFV